MSALPLRTFSVTVDQALSTTWSATTNLSCGRWELRIRPAGQRRALTEGMRPKRCWMRLTDLRESSACHRLFTRACRLLVLRESSACHRLFTRACFQEHSRVRLSSLRLESTKLVQRTGRLRINREWRWSDRGSGGFGEHDMLFVLLSGRC